MLIDKQVLYLGRWVDRESFRTFVYNNKGEQKLAKDYDEFSQLIASGLWRAEKEPEDKKVVVLESKRGKKCHSQQKQ